jgi:hypothetical protein
MTGSGEWGPWVTHDGKGCPCAGRRVHVWLGCTDDGGDPDDDPEDDWQDVEIILNGHEAICIAVPCPSWTWQAGYYPIIRYRIHRPAALRELIRLAAEPYTPPAPARRVEEVA